MKVKSNSGVVRYFHPREMWKTLEKVWDANLLGKYFDREVASRSGKVSGDHRMYGQVDAIVKMWETENLQSNPHMDVVEYQTEVAVGSCHNYKVESFIFGGWRLVAEDLSAQQAQRLYDERVAQGGHDAVRILGTVNVLKWENQ